MARTLLYDPGMVGLPSVLVRTLSARVAAREGAYASPSRRAHAPWGG